VTRGKYIVSLACRLEVREPIPYIDDVIVTFLKRTQVLPLEAFVDDVTLRVIVGYNNAIFAEGCLPTV
jgi:hypothetical protein